MQKERLVAFAAMFLITGWLGLAVRPVESQEDEPDYPHGDFEGDCSMCHSPEGWTPVEIGSDFDHAEVSSFVLRYSHEQTRCSACHATLDFSATDPSCASCHADVHRAELGADCGRCHSTRSFIDPTTMTNAHLATRFPLRGTHRALDCEECHRTDGAGDLQWVNTPSDCLACHEDNYLATTDPDHSAGGFPQTCEQCHSSNTWRPAGFNHQTIPAGAACVDCHLENYQMTASPDHAATGIPDTCELCHATTAWTPATFNHNAVAGTPCVTCHLSNYQATTMPDHAANGFPDTCEQCHSTNDWTPATFDHNAVAGTPCANCHLTNYEATTNPDHQSAGYPTTCELCHSTNAWTPATDGGNHDGLYFPIYSGKHNNRWDSCNTCHTVPSNFMQFSCFGCHPHSDRQKTDGDHQGEAGYSYDSQACFNCHPQGD